MIFPYHGRFERKGNRPIFATPDFIRDNWERINLGTIQIVPIKGYDVIITPTQTDDPDNPNNKLDWQPINVGTLKSSEGPFVHIDGDVLFRVFTNRSPRPLEVVLPFTISYDLPLIG